MTQPKPALPLEPLTEREAGILRLMAEGLSNPEIAAQLVLSSETVRWYTKQIYSKLGVHNRTQASLFARDLGLLENSTATSLSPSQRLTLPVFATNFIGRDQEIADLAALLQDPRVRLVTVVGQGGIGKTRLCIEVARHLAAHYRDGVYYIPLIDVKTREQLEAAIASAMNIPLDQDTGLLKHAASFQALLLLDNFEGVLEYANAIGALLDAAPHIKILVTSHISLKLRHEWVRSLGGLHVPDGLIKIDDVEKYSAIQLFYENVLRVRGNFSLADHLECVAQICRAVQGIPLALELAAAWLKTLNCQDVAREIQRNVDFLATNHRDIEARHRSLRAVFEYAWNLLTDDEKRVFRRLLVFRGGFGLAAAEQVAGASVDVLSSLIDKSLLQQSTTGLYEIHNLLHQYADLKMETLSDETYSTRSTMLMAWSSLLRGNFDKVTKLAREALQTPDATSFEKSFALAALGFLAGVQGDYSQCRQLCEASASVTEKEPITALFAQLGLAIGHSAYGDETAARLALRFALNRAAALTSPSFSVLCLAISAVVLADELDPEHTAQLIALPFTHPASTLSWIKDWSSMAELQNSLQARLNRDAYANAWDQSQHLDLNQSLSQLLSMV
jgi:predicted ATPase/DNA-binding CsgD family transcriptional regulator